MLEEIVRIHSSEVSVTPIPKGRWVLEYGFPSVLNSGLPVSTRGGEIDSGPRQGVLDFGLIVQKETTWNRISV
jgi:hypothetical protein